MNSEHARPLSCKLELAKDFTKGNPDVNFSTRNLLREWPTYYKDLSKIYIGLGKARAMDVCSNP